MNLQFNLVTLRIELLKKNEHNCQIVSDEEKLSLYPATPMISYHVIQLFLLFTINHFI